jgi:hypothetical protein
VELALPSALIRSRGYGRQGVEDDNMNIIFTGGRTGGVSPIWDNLDAYLGASFSGVERHGRWLAKVASLEAELRVKKSETVKERERKSQSRGRGELWPKLVGTRTSRSVSNHSSKRDRRWASQFC